jgi:hypothetical protein
VRVVLDGHGADVTGAPGPVSVTARTFRGRPGGSRAET